MALGAPVSDIGPTVDAPRARVYLEAMNLRLLALVLVLATQPTAVLARYCATGHVQGSVCRGFVIEHCSMKTIAAVKGADGSLHELPGCFDQVSDFKAGRCWISTKAMPGCSGKERSS